VWEDPNLRTGLKLHLGNSDVDVDKPAHLTQLKEVFRAANRNRMAIFVHAHANMNLKRPYGAPQACVFWSNSCPRPPTLGLCWLIWPVQGALVNPLRRLQPCTRSDRTARCPRPQLILRRLHYGQRSRDTLAGAAHPRDGGFAHPARPRCARKGQLSRDVLQRWHSLPLTATEFRTIETKVAPFLQPVRSPSRGDCGRIIHAIHAAKGCELSTKNGDTSRWEVAECADSLACGSHCEKPTYRQVSVWPSV
jgi:hypothetical protein